jgi:phosphoglycerate dehydrogenase-like enzyme
MIRVALMGNTQPQAARLKQLLKVDAELILDDETRATRASPLEVDVALSIRFNAADIAAVHCRMIQCSGIGIDGIALTALPKTTIVCNVGEHEVPIAEYVMLGLLEHEIGMGKAIAGFSSANWGNLFRGRVPHGEMAGKTIGIVGFGHIGKAIAVRARAFGMKVIGVNRSGRAAPEADRIVKFTDMNSVLGACDYVVLACPLTEETRGIVGAEALAPMKPAALLDNDARGEVEDEDALYAALTASRIGGALIDTWYNYPTLKDPNPRPAQHVFETLPNVRPTPHIAGWTEGLMERRYAAMAENIRRFASGEPLLNVVWRDGAPAGQ